MDLMPELTPAGQLASKFIVCKSWNEFQFLATQNFEILDEVIQRLSLMSMMFKSLPQKERNINSIKENITVLSYCRASGIVTTFSKILDLLIVNAEEYLKSHGRNNLDLHQLLEPVTEQGTRISSTDDFTTYLIDDPIICRAVSMIALKEDIETPESPFNAEHKVLLALLGDWMYTQYESFHQVSDLQYALKLSEASALQHLPGELGWSYLLDKIAYLRSLLYSHTKNIKDLNLSLENYQRLLDREQVGSQGWRTLQGNRALTLWHLFLATKSSEDLDATINAYEAGLANSPSYGANNLYPMYSNLGTAYLNRYHLTNNLADMEKSITTYENCSSLIEHGMVHDPDVLFNLTNLYLERYQHLGKQDDLASCIDVAKQVRETKSLDHSKNAVVLERLLRAYQNIYQISQDPSDLINVTQTAKHIIQISQFASDNQEEYLKGLLSVGAASLLHFEAEKHPQSDLDVAQALVTEVLNSNLTLSDDNRAFSEVLMAHILIQRFRSTGESSNLESAITWLRQSVGRNVSYTEILHMESHRLLGDALRDRFSQLHTPQDIDDSIQELEIALQANIPKERLITLNNLALSYQKRYESFKKFDDLQRAISLSREVVANQPDDALAQDNFAMALSLKYENSNQIADLEEALQINQFALDTVQANTSDWASILSNRGFLLEMQYKVTGNIDHINAAIDTRQTVLTYERLRLQDKAQYQINLARSLSSRYNTLKQKPDIDQVCDLYQNTLALCAPGSPYWAAAQLGLAKAQKILYQDWQHNKEVLDRSIESYRQAADVFPLHTEDWFSAQVGLGEALIERFEINEIVFEDLDAAQEICQALLTSDLLDAEKSAKLHSTLAIIFDHRFEISNNQSDLENAITYSYKTLENISHESEYWDRGQSNLAAMLRKRYLALGNPNDLHTAIDILHSVIDSQSKTAKERSSAPINLAVLLSNRYQSLGDLQDLQEAIAIMQARLEITPEQSENYYGMLNNFGYFNFERFRALSNMEDLETAINAYQQALEFFPSETPTWADIQGNLGTALRVRYETLGNLADLENAIVSYQISLDFESPGSRDWILWQGQLGNALTVRYRIFNRILDLNAAINALQKSLSCLQEGTHQRAGVLDNLSNCFVMRYYALRQTDDLNAAIDANQDAQKSFSFGSDDWAGAQINLSSRLIARFNLTHQIDDLNSGMEACRSVIEKMFYQSPHSLTALRVLSGYYYMRFEFSGNPDDLAQAIAGVSQVAQNMLPTSYEYLESQKQLGNYLIARFRLLSHMEDFNQAISIFKYLGKIALPDVRPDDALDIAQSLGELYLQEKDWLESANAYRSGLIAARQIYRTQIIQSGQEMALRETNNFYSRSAYVLARSGAYDEAVVAVEQGRAQRLGEYLAHNAVELQQLHDQFPDVYNEYHTALAAFRMLDKNESLLPTDQRSRQPHQLDDDLIQKIHTANARLETAIKHIQSIPGYGEFLGDLGIEKIKMVVSAGQAVVYLITTDLGSLALILQQSTANTVVTTQAIFIDNFKESDLDDLMVKVNAGKVVGGYLPGQFGMASDVAIMETIMDVGKRLLQPLALHLRTSGIQSITFVPVGVLGLLPLHAACYEESGQQVYMLDEFTQTYAPSANVMRSVQNELATRLGKSPVLVGVGNPMDNPHPLLYAQAELETISTFFSEDQVFAFYETAATKDALLSHLPEAGYVHLSCHGMFDPFLPINSHLQLANGELLTLGEIMEMPQVRQTRLIVLSACQTAMIDYMRLPNEAIGLPAGFLQAGFPGVVGTLWPVNDLSTALLMIRFYKHHLQDHLPPAVALRQAQIWLRDVTNETLSELFQMYRDAANTPQTRMGYELAQEKFRQHTLAAPDAKPFQNPYYWAGFVFYGV